MIVAVVIASAAHVGSLEDGKIADLALGDWR
jgi:imidazolonepropionase-like amidohydrolase